MWIFVAASAVSLILLRNDERPPNNYMEDSCEQSSHCETFPTDRKTQWVLEIEYRSVVGEEPVIGLLKCVQGRVTPGCLGCRDPFDQFRLNGVFDGGPDLKGEVTQTRARVSLCFFPRVVL